MDASLEAPGIAVSTFVPSDPFPQPLVLSSHLSMLESSVIIAKMAFSFNNPECHILPQVIQALQQLEARPEQLAHAESSTLRLTPPRIQSQGTPCSLRPRACRCRADTSTISAIRSPCQVKANGPVSSQAKRGSKWFEQQSLMEHPGPRLTLPFDRSRDYKPTLTTTSEIVGLNKEFAEENRVQLGPREVSRCTGHGRVPEWVLFDASRAIMIVGAMKKTPSRAQAWFRIGTTTCPWWLAFPR